MRNRIALLLLATATLLPAQSKTAPTPWVGSWSTAIFDGDPWHTIPTLVDSTLRQIVHTSVAGAQLRVRLSNEFGKEPLRVDAASVALSTGDSSIDLASNHALTFGGSPSIVIPPGAEALSDAVPMATDAFANLAVSLYLPLQQVSNVSVHSGAQQTNFIQTGNHVREASLNEPVKMSSWFFLKV